MMNQFHTLEGAVEDIIKNLTLEKPTGVLLKPNLTDEQVEEAKFMARAFGVDCDTVFEEIDGHVHKVLTFTKRLTR
jgi:hypothetical protein